MANTVLTYIFALHFSIAFAQLGFYFYLHENYAVNSVSVKIAYFSDVLLCARACAVDLNCNTATYITTKKRCEMTEERIGNISNKVPVITLKGCSLIEKVEIAQKPQESMKEPASLTGVWLHFTPQWCTESGRRPLGHAKVTSTECKEKCKGGCLGVEWWEKSQTCYECTNPSMRANFTKEDDAAFPPHVFLKRN
ncbi:uncharacterized protein [Montipora capricornis]|uniref:uncharacterized protein n=1 Tax=Montipora capricornis TaxID=246305 RepID=UPI0035F13488